MYIARLAIEGVRSFHSKRKVDLSFEGPNGELAGWTVIAGRNGSGKSTLLRAMVLALAGPARALQLAQTTRDWISSDESVGTVEVEIAFDAELDRPKKGRLPKRGKFWAGLSWEVEDGASRAAEIRPTEQNTRNPTNVRKAANNALWSEQPVGWFYAAYGPFRRLIGEGSEATRLMMGPLPLARVGTLFREDATLAEGVQWLKYNHLRGLEQRPGADEMVDFVIRLLNDGLLPDNFRADHVDSEGLWLERDGRMFPLDEMSDGYRAVTALVVDLVRSVFATTVPANYDTYEVTEDGTPRVLAPGVVVIDEIEAHLHVSWQRWVGIWLCAHFPNVQFIVTTHSPFVCQSARDGGLIRLSGPDENVSPVALSPNQQRRIAHGTADEAVLSDLFGLDSLYMPETRKLRHELAKLEAQIVLQDATADDRARYAELLELLQTAPFERVGELDSIE